MENRRLIRVGFVSAALLGSAMVAQACNSVLGIGDRSLDPQLDATAESGSGSGSSSSGGSGSGSGGGSGSSSGGGSASSGSSSTSGSSSGTSGSGSGSSSGTSGSGSGSSSGSGDDGGSCGDPCLVASGLNHPFLLTSDANRVYWTEFGNDLGTANGSVKSCPIDGCGSGALVYAVGQLNPRGIAVDAQNVYWATASYGGITGGILSCPITGCAGGPQRLANASIPYGVTVDANYVYWVDKDTYTVGRVAKSGAGGGTLLYDGGSGGIYEPNLCTVDSTGVYLADTSSGVYRVPLTGGNPITVVAPAGQLFGTTPVVVSASDVYYGSLGGIYRAPKMGTTDAGMPVAMNIQQTNGLVVDPASMNLYWSDWGSGLAYDGTVGKVPLAGGNSSTLHAALVSPEAVAVSGNYVFWLSNGSFDDAGSTTASTGVLYRSAK